MEKVLSIRYGYYLFIHLRPGRPAGGRWGLASLAKEGCKINTQLFPLTNLEALRLKKSMKLIRKIMNLIRYGYCFKVHYGIVCIWQLSVLVQSNYPCICSELRIFNLGYPFWFMCWTYTNIGHI
mgnify:CR=1 FL=1